MCCALSLCTCLQTAALQGAVGVSIASYTENGGALQAPLLFPEPNNQTSSSTRRRSLLQATLPYADSNVQILCQSCNDTAAMLADLNTSSPSQLFSASGRCLCLLACSTMAKLCCVIHCYRSSGPLPGILHSVSLFELIDSKKQCVRPCFTADRLSRSKGSTCGLVGDGVCLCSTAASL